MFNFGPNDITTVAMAARGVRGRNRAAGYLCDLALSSTFKWYLLSYCIDPVELEGTLTNRANATRTWGRADGADFDDRE